MQKPLEIEYLIEEKDFINFKLTEIIPEKFRILGYILMFIVLISIILNSFLLSLLTGMPIRFVDFFPLIFVAGFVYFFYYQAKKEFRGNSSLRNMMKITLTGFDFLIEGDGFESKLSWSKILRVREKKNYFLFFTAERHAFILSKAMISSKQKEELDSHLCQIANLDYKRWKK